MSNVIAASVQHHCKLVFFDNVYSYVPTEIPFINFVLSSWLLAQGGLFSRTINEFRKMQYQNRQDYYFDSSKFLKLKGHDAGKGLLCTGASVY
ncbi:hypothetical protein [Niabella hirudinis]|uniref:hypothetical protein n=1 Tax=Niabella hirudinis TaxID=1285929 RepID=UPI003EBD158D